MRWVYFRKAKRLGSFDLFSDNESKIKHLNRVLALFVPLFVMELVLGLMNVSIDRTMNRMVGVLALSVGALIGYGIYKILSKRSQLKKEHVVFE